MILNLTSIITVLALGTPFLILIMLLPAILELRQPKDGGPRMIMDGIPNVPFQVSTVFSIVNMEEEQKFDVSLLKSLGKVIGVLPSLEV
jgi:hypothetical protein